MFRLRLVVALLSTASLAQSVPPNLADWDLICFCTFTRGAPHKIIRADNNGQILFLARNGITREGLKAAGVPVLESQIQVLEDWRLLSHDGEQLKTNIPVLGPEETGQLRTALQRKAKALAPTLAPGMQHFLAALKQQGYSDNAFSIVFSYLLDGIVWDRFREQNALPAMQVTAEKPFWDGSFWAMYPKRDAPGTNTMGGERWSLAVTWRGPVLATISPLNNSNVMDPFLNSLGTSNAMTDEKTRRELTRLGIIAADGKLRVPVIHEKQDDSVYGAALSLSREIATYMLEARKSMDLRGLTHTPDEGQALLIAYHEFMWELLACFEQAGWVTEPAVLSQGVGDDPARIRSLVFVVESKVP